MNRYQFIAMDQPAGRFYITKINASKLIPISQSKERDPYNSTGIQRKLNLDRVKEIAKYCESPTAMFPTPIILSGKSDYFSFYSSNENMIKNAEYVNLNSGFIEIDSERIIANNDFLSIVDGQHRLAGIENSDDCTRFDLLVMFIFDTENYEDAEIFSVINRNQKQVSKSLVYDLYGLSDDMTVEKFAHEIVKALNTSVHSSLKGRIKMLGYKIDNFDTSSNDNIQYVSQGALVDRLLPMISKNSTMATLDNQNLRNGNILENGNESQILRRYLIQDNLAMAQIQVISFFNAWLSFLEHRDFENTIMFKTVGFIAGLNIYKKIYKEVENNEEVLGTSFYDINDRDIFEYNSNVELIINKLRNSYYRKLEEMNIQDLEIDKISSSLSGANYIEKTLLRQ